MKVIDSSADVILQSPGIVGMLKQIERVGRLSYKSEDRTTEESYIKFVEMLKNRGHWSVFEHGTVYLTIPKYESESMLFLEPDENKPCYNKFCDGGDVIYVTTNYRFILQNGLEEVMEKYWTEPGEHHYRRITTHLVCSRIVSHQLVRHRVFSFMQESQRYVNYSKERFGSGITFIIPQWAYESRQNIGTTVDPQTYEPRDYILSMTGEELWSELCCWDRKVASRDRFWQACEDEYMYGISEEDGKLNPEDARGCLCNDTKTELCITGYLQDWIAAPDEEKTPEKFGFFYLRSAQSAQRDIRVLSKSLEKQFKELGLYELK